MTASSLPVPNYQTALAGSSIELATDHRHPNRTTSGASYLMLNTELQQAWACTHSSLPLPRRSMPIRMLIAGCVNSVSDSAGCTLSWWKGHLHDAGGTCIGQSWFSLDQGCYADTNINLQACQLTVGQVPARCALILVMLMVSSKCASAGPRYERHYL